MKYHFWKLKIFSDSRGNLCPVEFKEFPFIPKRAYFLFKNTALRGGHAHLKEQEIFICIAGSFRATIHDGKRFRRFNMNTPGCALYTPNLVWHEFDNFSSDAVMLAFSSIPYRGQKEYIMDFEHFLLGRAEARLSN